MIWFPWIGRKKVVCFVDDDQDELERFEEAMSSREFVCVTATTHEKCVTKLKSNKLTPDLWVLDLYFPEQGKTNSHDELNEMNEAYAKLEQSGRDFRALLRRIGQGPEGGLDLLEKCRPPEQGLVMPWTNYSAPVVMFTRKGNLEDALICQRRGAVGVFKKPMPKSLDGSPEHRKAQLDDALLTGNAADELAEQLSDAIKKNSFLYKHRGMIGAVVGAVAGALARYVLS